MEERSAVANTYFGQLIRDEKATERDLKVKPKGYTSPIARATTLATIEAKGIRKPLKCILCDKDHYLDQCDGFKGKTVEQRMNVAKDKSLL